MCKVRIVNKGSNYISYNNTELETDIPTEVVNILEQVFRDLNANRKSATMPSISINRINQN